MAFLRRAAMTTVGAGAAALAWASLVERHWYAVRQATVPVLAPGSRSIRILHLSDLHLVPRQEHRIQWVRSLTRLQPDFVVNTGDNCSDPDAVPAVLRASEPLLEVPGAFVMGSNDFFAPVPKNPFRYLLPSGQVKPRSEEEPNLPVGELIAGFEQGWSNLNNRRGRVKVRGVDLDLVGVNDPHIGLDRYADVTGPADPAAGLTVGVLHAPYTHVLDPMSADGASLILAGHTHGGQVALPGYGALSTNCDLDLRRAKGLSRWWPGANGVPSAQAPERASWLNVSAGLGHSKYAPIRFACRPEASLLTLVPRPS